MVSSSVKSAERTVRILETLAASPARLTIPELQERTGYPRSSLHALIRTLRDLEWLETDETGSAFAVGPRALLAGTSYLDRDPALPYAYEALEDLRAELGYTVHYARRDHAHVLYLASRESRDAVRTVPRVGRRLPIHLTALGQAILAELTQAETTKILPPQLVAYTPHTITDHESLHDELDAVRARGWALEREQGSEGIACVAAVVAYRIPATDALSCSMPAALAEATELERVAAAVVRYADRLAGTLRRAGIR
ncbi:IclR family transcriptional regulator [Phytoactinopolyspora alkaliphila]|uniref:Glycerol operon regulatory protein n=1 Tax=Phytoactinopolyspora alkaliphila TaxID=1783498 RepID=A0A6N9YJ12_9ACTN|nr:IclR family transcriptional regulator [Phytoactinopolyspora alkaliphila]